MTDVQTILATRSLAWRRSMPISTSPRTLEARGIPVLANAGEVVVSYHEWVQNRTGDYWSAEQVEARLTERLDREAKRCFERAAEDGVSLRRAAYLQGLGRIAEAMEQRGTYRYFGNGAN